MTTPRVVGLDLSLTATGIADFTHRSGEVVIKTIRSNPDDGGIHGRHARLRAVLQDIREHIAYQGTRPALVVVEGPSYGSQGAGTWDRAGLWWLTVDFLTEFGHPLAVVPPAVVKKYATGRGNATKTDMAVALAKRADGFELRDDNQVDAWWLAAAGRDHLGVPYVTVPAAQRAVLGKVAWPEVTA